MAREMREKPVQMNVAERWERIKDAVPTLTEKALAEKKKMAQG